MGRHFIEHGLILCYSFAQLIFLETAPRSIEMFVSVRSHGEFAFPLARWGRRGGKARLMSPYVRVSGHGSVRRAGRKVNYITDGLRPFTRNEGDVPMMEVQDLDWLQLAAPDFWACLEKPVTFSRMEPSDIPLRSRAANPRKIRGIVRPRKAKIENPVAVVFSI